jgi:transcriptional regulator with XRE-family HTH domain
MPQNSGIGALNWDDLVKEALRRRKAEGVTQREHAALASVSIPTMGAFERGERTLTLAKAFDILRVVGLIEEQGAKGAHETFVKDAHERWRSLTSSLPDDSPGRFPHGWYRIDYCLEGDLRHVEPSELLKLIEKAEIRHTGWPMFVIMTRSEFKPQEIDGLVEAWMKPDDGTKLRALADPAHCDFWRAAPSGRFFIMRGYQEDAQETVPPGTIFDTTLPIWRLGEGLLHGARMAALLKEDAKSEVNVRFRARYSGLAGRVLRSLNPGSIGLLHDAHAAKSDEAILETALPAHKIEEDLAAAVHPLISSLYERFSVPQIHSEFVAGEIARFRQGRF